MADSGRLKLQERLWVSTMTSKDKELVFILRKAWVKHPELQLAATRIEKLNAKVDEWRTKYDNLLQSAFKQSGKTRGLHD